MRLFWFVATSTMNIDSDALDTRVAAVKSIHPKRWKVHQAVSLDRLRRPKRAARPHDTHEHTQSGTILMWITPLARPRIAGSVAFCVYIFLAGLSPRFLGHSDFAYFNYLADAFLHGQLSLRLPTVQDIDLVLFADKVYLYWPPFPAILVMPLVALFGVAVSDVIYTAILAAISVALLAKVLEHLGMAGIAPLDAARRAILVATCAFGSVLFTLSPHGSVWITAQVVGWTCVLTATLIAITKQSTLGYFLVGVSLSCAVATRLGLLFTGVWLAYYMLRRDWHQPARRRVAMVASGLFPLGLTFLLLGWYNVVRFGAPLDMGLAWHNYGHWFADDFARYGVFNIHYLATNVYHHFIVFPVVSSQAGIGCGLFWMTPVLLGAPYALWRRRSDPLIWVLALSCLLVYIPIGLVMGTGYLFGSRYLLDLMVPLIVLTAIGVRYWRLSVLQLLLIVSCGVFTIGTVLLTMYAFLKGA